MSIYTRVVVVSRAVRPGAEDRMTDALAAYAEAHDGSARFTQMQVPDFVEGFGGVHVGSVNHLDTTGLLDAVRTAVTDGRDHFEPVTVVLSHEDSDDYLSTHSLDSNGIWSSC